MKKNMNTSYYLEFRVKGFSRGFLLSRHKKLLVVLIATIHELGGPLISRSPYMQDFDLGILQAFAI